MITLKFPFRLISKDNEKITNRQGRFFLSKKYKDWESKVQLYTKQQYRNDLLLGNIEIGILADFTNKTHADATNLFKGLCDALQGVVYENDRQIKLASILVTENSPKDAFQINIEILKK